MTAKANARRGFGLGLAVIGAICAFSAAHAQTGDLDLSAFEGWETWPVVEPGEMTADNAGLTDQRIVFDAKFPGPGGLSAPLEPTTMIIDVAEVYFKGEPAFWIQYTSSGRSGSESGTAALDYLLVDRKTHKTLHRVQSVGGRDGPQDRAGPLVIWNYSEDRVVLTRVQEDGSADTNTIESDSVDTIDYAAIQFWLPFIDLEAGKKFRVPYASRGRTAIVGMPVHVKGRVRVEDAHGKKHNVWAVQIMSQNASSLSEFWVSDTAPYFYGWDVRLKAGSKPITQMRLNKFFELPRAAR
jgi:hypothetical protein